MPCIQGFPVYCNEIHLQSRMFDWDSLLNAIKKMPKIDTLDALEEHEEHEDDYQTNSNW